MLYNLTASSEGSKLSERLLARAPHTNKQCMATVNAYNAVHSGQMFQGIVKKDQIHPRLVLIIFL